MLHEFRRLRQEPSGFQLCYDKAGAPRALTWTAAEGYRHEGIDDGDWAAGGHKGTPLLVPDG